MECKFPVGRYAESHRGGRVLIVHRTNTCVVYPVIAVDEDGDTLTYTDSGVYSTDESFNSHNLVTLLPTECDSFDWEPADEDDEPSCPAVDVLETHRLLDAHEKVLSGDEYLVNGEWHPAKSIGPLQNSNIKYRRPLPTVQLLCETTEIHWSSLDDKWDVETTGPAKLLKFVGTVSGGRLFFLAD